MKLSLRQIIPILIPLFLIILSVGLAFYIKSDVGEKSFTVESEEKDLIQDSKLDLGEPPPPKTSPITGEECENYNRRPFAVMLAEDIETRPLSGIAMADLVIEMPVITGSVTRLMAVYICNSPEDIGSVRSARHDFIPLAMGLDTIFVHWGGSHYALDKLNAGIMDNINALYNPFNAFYRKSGVPQPHNGFTSMERLLNTAENLGYRLESQFEGYKHLKISNAKAQISNQIPAEGEARQGRQNSKSKKVLEIGYPYPFNVRYDYNPETNSYYRWRGNTKEIDKLDGKQVETKNIVVMRAKSRQIEGQYNDVDIEGRGEMMVFRNGEVIVGSWAKDELNPFSKLYFYDSFGKELRFIPGSVWIEIVEPYQRVEWKEVSG